MALKEILDKTLKLNHWKNMFCFEHLKFRIKCENRCFEYIYCKECFKQLTKSK